MVFTKDKKFILESLDCCYEDREECSDEIEELESDLTMFLDDF